MKKLRTVSCFVLFAVVSAGAFAEDLAPIRQVSATGIKHSVLVTGSPDAARLFDEDCKVVWEAPGYSRDGYVLENGNILISDSKMAKEYKAGTNEVVWSYTLSPDNSELGTVFRLPNGDTMTCELGKNPRLIEVGPDGQIRKEVKLQPDTDNAHMQTRMARKLPSGNYLVPHLFAFKIKEYTPTGEVVREIPTDLPELGGREIHNWPFTAILLDNGNILANLTHGDKTVEFDPAGKVVWRVDNDNTTPPGKFADACGGQRLPNGNTVITAYGQKDPAKCKIFEVTRDKKVVWEFFHPDIHAHEIHVITTNGKKITPILR